MLKHANKHTGCCGLADTKLLFLPKLRLRAPTQLDKNGGTVDQIGMEIILLYVPPLLSMSKIKKIRMCKMDRFSLNIFLHMRTLVDYAPPLRFIDIQY